MLRVASGALGPEHPLSPELVFEDASGVLLEDCLLDEIAY